jgi:hypothetical protein
MLTAAAELEERRYVLFDTATEEALIRTYIRNDELMRNPKMALSVVSGYQATASKVLRAFIVTEVLKAKEEHPEFSSWEHDISKADVTRLLTRKGSDSVTYTNQIEVPITNRITNPDPGTDDQSDSVHIPSTYTYTSTPTPNTQESGAPSGATARGTRLPDGWRPTDETIAKMRARFPAVDFKLEHEKFTNHWRSQPGAKGRKSDWEATWCNWIIRTAEQAPQRNGGAPPATRKVGVGLELANRLGDNTPEMTA